MKKENDNTNTFNILVVEDAPPNQMLLKLLLQKMGHHVTIANNGKEAVEIASENIFDLILMDMQMPVMNGFLATRELRRRNMKTPIVAITANVLQEDIDKAYEAGCDDYLAKPIDRKSLKVTVEKHLSNHSCPITDKINTLKHQTELLSRLCDTDQAVSSTNDDHNTTNLVDLDDAMKYCGDEKAIKRVAKSVLTDGRQCVKMIESAINDENTSDLLLAAHRLRGIFLLIGAKQPALTSDKIEHQASTGCIGNSDKLLQDLIPQFDALVEFLSQPQWFEKAAATVKAFR